MWSVSDVQKFIIWLFGSIAIFGCISTLIVYAMYDGGSTVNCDQNDPQCMAQNQSVEVNKRDTEILRIVSPTAIAVGVVAILLVRCWQQSTRTFPNEGARIQGEENNAYTEQESNLDSPPSYSDALGMDAVLEAHGSFPEEAPPKYDDIVCYHSEGEPHTRGHVVDSAQQTVDIEDDGIIQDINDSNTAAQQTVGSSDDEDSRSQESEHSVTDDAETSTAREDDLHDEHESARSPVQEQTPTSQDVRIFVRQRDSNISCDEFGDLGNCAEDSSDLRRGDAEATPAALTQADSHTGEMSYSTASPNSNFEQDSASRSSIDASSLGPQSQVNSELNHSSSALALTGCNRPDSVSLSIPESIEGGDSSVETNRTSFTTEL